MRKLIFPLLAVLLVSCHNQPVPQDSTDSFTDDYDRTVCLPANPRRIVSTSPSVTEILFALGADSLLVGRTDFCVYPAAAADIPSIGGISNLNIERILSLKPDFVISGSMVARKAVDQMQAMGVPMVCVVEKPRFEALYDNISVIGRLVGRECQADSLINSLKARVNSEIVNGDNAAAEAPKSCYYVVGYGPSGNFTAGGNTFINDIIRLAGGRNIAEDIDGWSYSLEALVSENPDYIIIRREDSAAFVNTRPYSTLDAVRQGHVIGMESGMIDLQVPRNIDAVLLLRQRLKQ